MWGQNSAQPDYRPPALWQTLLALAVLFGVFVGGAWWLRDAPDAHAFYEGRYVP